MLIVTDGAVDLPEGLDRSPMLRIVPGQVWLGDKPFAKSPDELWSLLRQGTYPSTTPPTVSALVAAYQDSDGVVAVHVSSELSSTVARAREAAVRCGGGVLVVDTRSLSVGAGLIVAAITRAAGSLGRSEPAERESIEAFACSLPDRLHTFALVQHVEALRRNDRSGLLPPPNLARNRPLLLAIRGRVVPLEGIKNREAGIKSLGSHILHSTGGDLGAWAIGHGDAGDLDAVVDELTRAIGVPPAIVACLDSTVGVHVGPDAVVVAAISGAIDV